MKKFKYILSLIMLLAIGYAAFSGRINEAFKNKSGDGEYSGKLEIRYVNVGQGDCELIKLPSGGIILIDSGDRHCSDDILPYLSSLGVEKIDYLIATHPHADHIGALDDVLREIPTENVVLPKIAKEDVPTTKSYEELLTEIKNSGCEVIRARRGETLLSEEDLSVELLAPYGEDYPDLNGYSAVLRLQFGERAFLFMGDADYTSEEEMLREGEELSADVLKLGHHGSSTSTSDEFLDEVNPQYAIISAGRDNEYGHPHSETLQKLKVRDIEAFKTYSDGTVIAECDGKNITFEKSDENMLP